MSNKESRIAEVQYFEIRYPLFDILRFKNTFLYQHAENVKDGASKKPTQMPIPILGLEKLTLHPQSGWYQETSPREVGD
jgi:hypothetical protein